jgi:VWFA-related protein
MRANRCLGLVGCFLVAAVVPTSRSAPQSETTADQTSISTPAAAQQASGSTPASSQQASSSSPSIRTQTRLITVDVVATDSRGNPARGLKASDFQIFDNRTGPQMIARFEYIERSAVPPATPASQAENPATAKDESFHVYSNQALPKLAVPPTVVLLDPLNIAFTDQLETSRELHRLLKSLPAETPIAVLLLRQGLTIVQNFTTDRAALGAAVDRSMGFVAPIRNPEDDPDNGLSWFGHNNSAEDFEKLEYEEQTTVLANQTSDAMRAIAKYLSGYPGRKNLVWVSEAFPVWLRPANDFGPDSHLNDPFRQPFQGSANYGAPLHTDAEALIDARVTVYPVDARGLDAASLYDASENPLNSNPTYAQNPASIGPGLGGALAREDADRYFAQATMEQMAADTGGQLCKNTNDLSGCLTTALKNSSSYYELSYYPENVRWDGSFHHITLRTDLHGVKLHYRSGYLATDTIGLAKQQPIQVFKQACASLLPVTSIPLTAEALPPAKPDEARYLLTLSARGLSVTPVAGKLEFDLRAGVCEYAPKGGAFQIHARDISRSMPLTDAASGPAQDITDVFDYKAKPETKRIRLAVLDVSTGLTGTVDVPAHPRAVTAPELSAGATTELLFTRLAFQSSLGPSSAIDSSGDRLEYRGNLPADRGAPAFFGEIYGGRFHCQGGSLVANAPGGKEPDLRFLFRNPSGLAAVVDLSGRKPAYSGGLPVDETAKAFFSEVWKFCHCQAQ